MKTDPRIARSRAKIRETFLALLQDHDLEDVTVRDLSRLSGVGYSTFYRHYETKADLISEIARLEVEAFVDEAFPVLIAQPPAAACLLSARHIVARRSLWLALTSGSASATLRETLLAKMLARGEGIPFGSAFLPRAITASIAATILVDLLAWWLRDAADRPPEHLAEAMERLIVNPALRCW